MPSGKSEAGYWLEPSGEALKTAHAHSDQAEHTLFGAGFCPFVQRTWIALESSNGAVSYRYFENDPYKKSKELLEVSPRGLVPALRLVDDNGKPRAVSESTVIADYIEDLLENKKSKGLLPSRSNPYARAKARFIADHVNRSVVPNFYRYLQAQETEKQVERAKDFFESLKKLCELLQEASDAGLDDAVGLWKENGELGWVDMQVAPWLLRSEIVLTHYRGWQTPTSIAGYKAWLDRVLASPAVRKTTSTEELYLDSYARYAENRPGTSKVLEAINSGKPLP